MKPCEILLRTDVPVEPGLCFIIMPFGDQMDSVYDAGIRPALEALGMKPHRADESFSSLDIMSGIFDSILRSEIIIADLTHRNPNVFYELGLAHAIKRHVVLITQDRDDVPFDLGWIRYFKYENTMEGARTLAQNLERIIRQLRATPTEQTEEIQNIQQILQHSFKTWVGIGDVILTLREFSLIVLHLDDLTLDDDRVAYVAVCAAYFGRHLTRALRRVADNRQAISKLVDVVARSPMLRPSWRAGAMLEHCNQRLVSECIEAALKNSSLNDERRMMLDDTIRHRGVLPYLTQLTQDMSVPPDVRGKAGEALRQLTAEFSLSA